MIFSRLLRSKCNNSNHQRMQQLNQLQMVSNILIPHQAVIMMTMPTFYPQDPKDFLERNLISPSSSLWTYRDPHSPR